MRVNANERLEIIRAKARRNAAAVPAPLSIQKPKDTKEREGRVRRWVSAFAGPIEDGRTNCMTDWIYSPDPKPVQTLRPKRTYKPHALTLICDQLPAKLPVLTFCPKTRRKL